MSDAGSSWINVPTSIMCPSDSPLLLCTPSITQVAVHYMSWQNFTTGELSRPYESDDCESFYDSGTPPPASALSSEESTTPQCLIAEAQRPPAPACRNTIASIKYTIHHKGDVRDQGKQQIVAVNATIASKRVTYDVDKQVWKL